MMPKLKFFLIGSLAILILSFFGFNYWQSQPSYSLSKIQESIETKNPDLFFKHVDIENILSEFFKDSLNIYDQYLSNMFGASNDLEYFDPEDMAKTVLFFINPQIESSIRNGLGDTWKNPSKAFSTEYLSEENLDVANNFFQSAKLAYLNKEGDSAFLGISMLDSNSQKILTEFELKKVKNYWQISKWSNFEEIINELIDNFINSYDDFREELENELSESSDFEKEWEKFERELEQELEILENEFNQELENLESELNHLLNTNNFEKELQNFEKEFENLLNSSN